MEKDVLSNNPIFYLDGFAFKNNKKIAYYVDQNYNNLKYENDNNRNWELQFKKTVNNETLDIIEETNYDTGDMEDTILLFAGLNPTDDGIDVRFIPKFTTYMSPAESSFTRCNIHLKNSNYPSKEIHSIFYFNAPQLDDTTFYHENFIENHEISSFNSSSLETGWYVETVKPSGNIIIDNITAKWKNDDPETAVLDLEVEMRWYW